MDTEGKGPIANWLFFGKEVNVRPFQSSILWLLAGCLLLCNARSFAQSDASGRTWFDGGGQLGSSTKIEGRPVRLVNDQLVFRDWRGQETTYELDALSDRDQQEALAQVIGSGVVAVYPLSMTDQPLGLGSGFVIDENGLIITNYHVVQAGWKIQVAFRDTLETHQADCLAVDPDNDVAIIRVRNVPKDTHILKLGGITVPYVNEEVWAIGHPKGRLHTVTRGHVIEIFTTEQSPLLLEISKAPKRTQWIQLGDMITQGNSGGPLLNRRGEVLGINTLGIKTLRITTIGAQTLGIDMLHSGFALHVLYAKDAYAAAQTAKPMVLPLEPSGDQSAMSWLCRDVALIIRKWEAEGVNHIAWDDKQFKQSDGLRKRYRQQLMKIVRREPPSWEAFQSGFFVVDLIRDNTEDSRACTKEVCDIVLQHHQERRGVDEFIQRLLHHHDDNTIRFTATVLKEPERVSFDKSAEHPFGWPTP